MLHDEPFLTDVVLTGAAGQVVAMGERAGRYEVVLVGWAEGFATDRSAWGLGEVTDTTVDDLTGEAWAVSRRSTLGAFDGVGWVEAEVPLDDRQIVAVAASGGRQVLLDAWDAVYVREVDRFDEAAIPFSLATPRVVTAAAGALFLVGTGDHVHGETPEAQVWRHLGDDWETLEVVGLPVGATPTSAWADGPSELWIGFAQGADGGLARWDGASWSVARSLEGKVPESLARGDDGALTYVLRGARPEPELWTWGAEEPEEVDGVPPHLAEASTLSDGRVVARTRSPGDDPVTEVWVSDPSGWQRRWQAPGLGSLHVDEGTIWASAGAQLWRDGPCEGTR